MKIRIDHDVVDKVIREGLISIGMFGHDLLDDAEITVYRANEGKCGLTIELKAIKK